MCVCVWVDVSTLFCSCSWQTRWWRRDEIFVHTQIRIHILCLPFFAGDSEQWIWVLNVCECVSVWMCALFMLICREFDIICLTAQLRSSQTRMRRLVEREKHVVYFLFFYFSFSAREMWKMDDLKMESWKIFSAFSHPIICVECVSASVCVFGYVAMEVEVDCVCSGPTFSKHTVECVRSRPASEMGLKLHRAALKCTRPTLETAIIIILDCDSIVESMNCAPNEMRKRTIHNSANEWNTIPNAKHKPNANWPTLASTK